MNTVMNSVINAAILSLPLTAAIWLALRLLPRRSLSAAARYVIWWTVLSAAIALPAAYPPPRISSRPISLGTPPARIEAPVFVAPHTTPLSLPLPARSRFPIRIPVANWTRWMAISWAASALLMLARLILSCFALLRRKRASQPIQLAVPLPRHARTLLSAEVPAPMAVGFLRPAILLPARFFDQLTPDQIEQIVLHESAHLARRDDYALVLQRAIEAAFALHPAVRFIARQLDLEREVACDDRVVQATQQAALYAACLTRVAEMSGRISFAAAAFSQDRSQLSRRVDMLLDHARTNRTRLMKTRLAFVAVMLTALAWTLAKTPTLLAFSTPIPASSPVPQARPQPAPVPAEPPKPQPAPKLIAQAVRPPAAPVPPQTAPAGALQPVSVVLLPVQATNANGDFVPGLTRDDFRVFEDGVQQPITYFALENSPPALEVVVFDRAILKLVTLDALAVLEKIPGTHVEYVQASDTPSRQLAAEEAVSRLQQLPNPHKILLLVGQRIEDIPQPAIRPDIRMDRSAERALPETLLRSYADPATSYVLGYPATAPDGKYKRIRVTVDRPGLMVRSRTGYYADTSRTCNDQTRGALALPDTAQCH
jgi:beta-lactamase regulating signal transducer with metallopeptidase domain